ncbi:hypothetical protein ACIRBZ_34615 [Streptomyces sp. NPDC094038]|uniref:hypothetical protein n=1 Tax=Streptomyces sp. NPDC094038 TaxID=3366055 RepID=UPI003822349D
MDRLDTIAGTDRTAAEITVLAGRTEIGTANPALLTEEVTGPRRLLLAGRSRQVTYIDWSRRGCFVEPVDGGSKAHWGGTDAGRSVSYELTRVAREVLLGADPPVTLAGRARTGLAQARENSSELVHPDGTVVVRGGRDTSVRWRTWAGYRANATLTATLTTIADPLQRPTDTCIRLGEDATPTEWREVISEATDQLCLPTADARALNGLKFSAALPPRLADANLAARLADPDGATAALRGPTRFTVLGQ